MTKTISQEQYCQVHNYLMKRMKKWLPNYDSHSLHMWIDSYIWQYEFKSIKDISEDAVIYLANSIRERNW